MPHFPHLRHFEFACSRPCHLFPAGTCVGTTAGLPGAASFHVQRPLHVSLRLDADHHFYAFFLTAWYLNFFSYSTKCFLFFSACLPLAYFTFVLGCGWLHLTCLTVCDIYRDQYFDSREQTSRSSTPIHTAVLHKSCYLNSLWHAAKWLVRLVACTEGAIN